MKKIIWIILAVSFSSVGARAENQEELNNDYYRKYFSGWKGIVFFCSFDADDNTLGQICQEAVSDIKLLAPTNNVKLKIAASNDIAQAALLADLVGYIILEYDLVSTKTKGENEIKAVHARLFYKIIYVNAVENNKNPDTLGGMARAGSLEIWGKSLIGKGGPTDIITPFSNLAELLFKEAVTLFTKYAK